MHVLLLGAGGREHALAWRLSQSPLLSRLTLAPGNPGMKGLGTPVELITADVPAYAKTHRVDLVIVGPEQPLADGLADALADHGIPCFGPIAAGAQVETSKGYLKDLCAEHGIPAPGHARFTDPARATEYVRARPGPYVIKADGLASGKGVEIVSDLASAEATINAMLAGRFGAASKEIVIEEFLTGPEVSVFALTDGETVLSFGSAQDHKRAFDGDTGPNTGGMGGFSPSPHWTPALEEEVFATIIRPTVAALRARGIGYRGVLYAGLMLTANGPKLIEYNCRFGDPECQMLMLRLRSDVLHLAWATATGRLAGVAATFSDDPAALIVHAANGYPGTVTPGTRLRGLDAAAAVNGVKIFHAGTGADADGVFAKGGRVLNVAATGRDYGAALERAYAASALVDWPEGFYRRDIGAQWRS